MLSFQELLEVVQLSAGLDVLTCISPPITGPESSPGMRDLPIAQTRQIANSKSSIIPHFDALPGQLLRTVESSTNAYRSSTDNTSVSAPPMLVLSKCSALWSACCSGLSEYSRHAQTMAPYLHSSLRNKRRLLAILVVSIPFACLRNFFAPLTRPSRNFRSRMMSVFSFFTLSFFLFSSLVRDSASAGDTGERGQGNAQPFLLPSFTEHLTTPFFS